MNSSRVAHAQAEEKEEEKERKVETETKYAIPIRLHFSMSPTRNSFRETATGASGGAVSNCSQAHLKKKKKRKKLLYEL